MLENIYTDRCYDIFVRENIKTYLDTNNIEYYCKGKCGCYEFKMFMTKEQYIKYMYNTSIFYEKANNLTIG